MCNCNSISINNGVNGSNGRPGGFTAGWLFDSSSVISGTPHKFVRLNNSDPSLVTVIYLSTIEIGNNDITPFVDSFNNTISAVNYYGKISVFDSIDSSKFAYYTLTGITTPGAGERALAVTYISGAGTFSGGSTLMLSFTPNGKNGTDGSSGAAGAAGAAGSNGSNGLYGGFSLPWLFSTSTSNNPASTFLRLNNASPAASTIVYVNSTTSDNVTSTAFLNSLSNNGLFGWIKITKTTDSTNYILAKITNTSISGSVYSLTITYVDGNSTFSASDPLFVSFTPAQSISQPFLFKGKLPSFTKDNTHGTIDNGIAVVPGTTGGDIILLEDTLATFNTATGIWTCPSTGYYNISYIMVISQSAASLGTGFYMSGITNTSGGINSAANTITLDADMKEGLLQGSFSYVKLSVATQLELRFLNRSSVDIVGSANAAGGDALGVYVISIVRIA